MQRGSLRERHAARQLLGCLLRLGARSLLEGLGRGTEQLRRLLSGQVRRAFLRGGVEQIFLPRQLYPRRVPGGPVG